MSEQVSTDGTPIPAEIMAEVSRQQVEVWNWPHNVPGWLEIGGNLWCKWEELTVARCEQATEFYIRKGRQAIRRFVKKPSLTTAKHAADHVIRARIVRCKYVDLLGKTDSTEDEMPFAHNRY